MHGIDIMETTFLDIEGEGEVGAVEDEAFEKLKNEMQIAQGSLHALAEENFAFKSNYPKRGDELKASVEKYQELSQRFKKVIEKFENIHSEQLDLLKKSLGALIHGTYLADSNQDALEISCSADFLREVELKEGVVKAELIRVFICDKKKLQARINYMQHLISDLNTNLSAQQGLLKDIISDGGGGNGRYYEDLPFGVVLSWAMLVLMAIGLCTLGLLIKFKPGWFGLD